MLTDRRRVLSAILVGGGLAGLSAFPAGSDSSRLTFLAHHEATLKDVPAGAKRARIWLVLPREDPAQKISGLSIKGPGRSSVETGGTYGNRFAYFDVENPTNGMKVEADFTVEREKVIVPVNPEKARALKADDARKYAAELAGSRYVPVDDKYKKLAQNIVGDEKNPARQAKKLYDWVLDYVEYWVKDPATKKASPNGESEYCLATKTGNCTDFHSLYASLSRSIGIPTRMVYGSFFQGENDPIPNKATLNGKDTDASYHCWVEVFVRRIGWVPLDVALADLLPTKEQQDSYFGSLDARRVTWSYGRDLTLAPAQDGGPVNAMHKVYVEIDGKPHAGWDRKLTYRSAQ